MTALWYWVEQRLLCALIERIKNRVQAMTKLAEVTQSWAAAWLYSTDTQSSSKTHALVWSFEFSSSCHFFTRSRCGVRGEGLILETFGMTKRGQIALFSMIWRSWGESEKPRWEMIKAWTKRFAEPPVGYSRIRLERFCTLQSCGINLWLLCGSCLAVSFSETMFYSLVHETTYFGGRS